MKTTRVLMPFIQILMMKRAMTGKVMCVKNARIIKPNMEHKQNVKKTRERQKQSRLGTWARSMELSEVNK